jgi:hypothetical protein
VTTLGKCAHRTPSGVQDPESKSEHFYLGYWKQEAYSTFFLLIYSLQGQVLVVFIDRIREQLRKGVGRIIRILSVKNVPYPEK